MAVIIIGPWWLLSCLRACMNVVPFIPVSKSLAFLNIANDFNAVQKALMLSMPIFLIYINGILL